MREQLPAGSDPAAYGGGDDGRLVTMFKVRTSPLAGTFYQKREGRTTAQGEGRGGLEAQRKS